MIQNKSLVYCVHIQVLNDGVTHFYLDCFKLNRINIRFIESDHFFNQRNASVTCLNDHCQNNQENQEKRTRIGG
jgi:hypothetical protein